MAALGLLLAVLLAPPAVAAPSGAISGKVTAAAGGAAIAGIEACAFEPSSPSGVEACATTASSGEYTIGGLADGEYDVYFFAPEQSGLDYVARSYPQAVTVANGALTSHVDVALQVGAVVKGKVSGGSPSSPLHGIEVCAFSAAQPFEFPEYCATTDAAGEYRLAGLPSGEYKVEFYPPYRSALNYLPQYYAGKASSAAADVLQLAAGATNGGIDATLAPGGEVAGRVTSAATSAGIAGVEVCASPVDEGRGNCALTDAGGAYTVAGLATGSYEVEFSVPSESSLNYVRQYFDGESGESQADPVSVTAGGIASSVDAAMQPGGTIGGTVTGAPSKEHLQGVQVCASGPGAYRCAKTNAAGEYAIASLPAGSYSVHFDATAGYVSQYYGSGGQSVALAAGGAVGGIDVELQPAAKIAGTVTAAGSGSPLEGIRVCSYAAQGGYEGSCSYTNASGAYTVGGLAAGAYKLEFSAGSGNFMTQYYHGKSSLSEGDSVQAVAGQTKSGIDVAMQPGGQITGKVTALASGQPAAGVRATVYRAGGEYVESTTTDANGEYRLPRLPTGNYKIAFASGSTNLIGEYYDHKSTLTQATEIGVTAGSTKSGIDAALAGGGELAGKVTAASGGAALANANVVVFSASGELVTSVYTDGHGEYVVRGLAEGAYRVQFFRSGFERQYYDGKAGLSTADPIAVKVGAVAAGIDAALQPLGSISGTVTDSASHAPVAGIEVCAYGQSGGYGPCATTGASGEYSLPLLETGRYKVSFSGGDYLTQYYDGKASWEEAKEVAVTAGSGLVGIDAALQKAGHVKGTVTAVAGGLPLGGIEVCVEPVTTGAYRCAATTPGGEYDVGGLPTGAYRVYFSPGESGATSNYLPQYYDGKAGYSEADQVSVVAGTTKAGVNAALASGGEIRGTVTSVGAEAPIGDATACAYLPEGSTFRCDGTDSAGHYAIDGLPSGEYVVYFYESGGGSFQYYNGVPSSSEATRVKVTAGGAARTGIDGHLHANGRIAGTVTSAATGEPLAGIEVCALSPEGSSQNCTTTPVGGGYSLPVASGQHKVLFRSGSQSYETQYYDGATTLGAAKPIAVAEAATTEGIDAAMLGPGQIAGRVTDEGSGSGLAGVQVCATSTVGSFFSRCAQSGADGSYAIANLPAGSYRVFFSAPTGMNYLPQYYPDKPAYQEAGTVTTTAATVTAGVDAAMQAGGEIKGKVTAAGSGSAIAGIEVCPQVLTSVSSYPGCARTDASGEYTIEKLPSAEYRVTFSMPDNSSLNYVHQTYDRRLRSSEGQRLTIASGAVKTGVDAALEAGGEVSGKVTRIGTKVPLQGVQVCPYEAEGFERAGSCATTDANGAYTLRGQPAGQEKLEFYLYEYFPRWYKEATESHSATAVPVEVLHTTSGIDVALKSTHPIVPEAISPPTISGTARQGETLTEHHGAWTNEPGEYAYHWLRCDGLGQNCQPIPDATGQTYLPVAADVGGTLAVQETATNLEGESLPRASAPTAIVTPAPPVNEFPPAIEGVTRVGETLEEVQGEWSNEPGRYTYQWERCDGKGESCTLIAGATEQLYELSGADVGHTMRVIETAENGGGESEPAVSSQSDVVVPEAPVNLSPPAVTGSPVQGKRLSQKHGSWTGEPSGYAYQWERCSAAGAECKPIDGATFPEYELTGADVGHELVATEAAFNSGGQGEPAASAPTAVVVAAPPANLSPPTVAGPARPGGTLSESHGQWSNEPTEYSYQWERCNSAGGSCVPIDGATEAGYVAEAADVGHRLVVEEVAANAAGAGEGATSAATAIVVAGVPANFRAPAIAGEARQGETLTETRGGWSNEPTSYEIEWQRCDSGGEHCVTASRGVEFDEYQLRGADLGHTIRVLETAVNAGGPGDPAASAPTAKVIASIPVGISPPTVDGETVEGETLSESHGNWTNEPSSYRYQWQRCSGSGTECEPIDGATAATHELAAADVGHRLVVVETAENAAGASAPQASEPTAVVEPGVPVNTERPTISGTVRVGSTLTEAHGAWTNQPTSFAYRWERCGDERTQCEPIDGATQQTYTPTGDDLGHGLVVIETATNQSGQGHPAASAKTGAVAPEPPVNVELPQIGGAAESGETLVAKPGTWRGEPREYREKWLRCDAAGGSCAAIHDAINPIYSPVAADVGHALRVRVVAVNDGGAGEAADSAATAVVTAAPLRAVPGEDLRATVGVPVTLDGSGSTPASEITAARWAFGDGAGGNGAILRHAYEAAGEYTATLTVERGAEVSERSVAVTVTGPPDHQATITVEDEGGQPVGGAEVLYLGSGGARTEAQTDGAGEAGLPGLPDGTDTVYVVADGFKPAVGHVTVAGGDGETTVGLVRGALGSAEVTSHEMTLGEIEAAGIDPDDPANQNVYEFEVSLAFPGAEPLRCHVNSAGMFVGPCGGGGGGWSCSETACRGGSSSVHGGAVEGHPFIQTLTMQGKATTLKQFFEVSLAVTNLSPQPFAFTHGQASLTIPNGMSLAPTASPQARTQSVADIPGEGSAKVKWIVRGDEPGEYNLAATYGAQLEPFEKPFELQAVLVTPLKVWGAEALGFDVEAESGSLREGVPYHVRIGIVDKADIPLYNVAVLIDSASHDGFIYQPRQEFEAGVGELKPGETVYAPEDILVPDADGGSFDPSRSVARFAGEAATPGEGIEAVAPAPLYSLTARLASATMIHLHWQPSPGAEGYEVFSTDDLASPFAATPDAVRTSASSGATVTRLGASATDAYIPRGAGDPPRFYAVATVIDGRLRLEHPVREPSVQGPVGGPLTLRELLAGGHNLAEFCLQCVVDRISHADPVDAPTGNFWHGFTDLSVPGRGLGLDLDRTYNSQAAAADGPFGHGWSFSYGISLGFPDATHVVVEQENGSAVSFSEEPDGSYAAPPRVTATLVHEGDGSWVFVRHRRETFAFDPAGRLMREQDLNGYVTSLAYDGAGRLQTVTDPAGRKLTFVYSGSHVSSVADPLGRTVHYSYDGSGNLVDVVDVAGGETHFTYDGVHRMLTMRMPDQAPGVAGSSGKTVTNAYDAQGRVSEQTDPLGRITTFAYSGEPLGDAGGTTTITDPAGNVTVQAYRYGELVSETQGYGTSEAATWEFAYDQETLGLAEVTDPNGHTVKSTYDEEGNLLTSEDALGRLTVNTYDALNDLLTSTDPLGITTTDSYDSRGNLLSTSRPLAGTADVQTTSYAYGDGAHPGDVTAMTDPEGDTWHYGYDASGDLTSTTDPLGNESTATYNAIGWRLSSTPPRGNAAGAAAADFTTTYAYDPFGQLTETTDPLGHTTRSEYDPDGNPIAATDADGNVTHFEYDAADQRIAVRRADGTTLRTAYTADGDVKEQIDAAGHATRYAYDALGRLIAVTDPLGRTTHYAYDAAGNETSMTDPEGGVTSKAYDAADELTSISYSDPHTPDVSGITYDADGERTGMTDGSGTRSWTWDSLHRLVSATAGDGGTVGYGYDLAGHLLSLTYPNGKTVSREYDAAGNLTAVTDWLGHKTSFEYDADSELSGSLYPGGVFTQIGRDDADRLSSIADTGPGGPLAGFSYGRDPNGQVVHEAVDNGEATARDYSYDSLNQLTSAGADPYAYDAADNPTGFGPGMTQSFDAGNQLTKRGEIGEAIEKPSGGSEPPSHPGGTSTPEAPSGSGGSGAAPGAGGHSPSVPPPPLAAVHVVSKSGRLKSPKLRTHGSNELLVAFVSAAGPASGAQRVKGLSGGSLHWSRVERQALPGGDAEVWQARSSRADAGQVTVQLGVPGYRATMAIQAYGGSAYVKAHATAHGHGSAPAIVLPRVSGATTVGAGSSSGQKGGVVPSAGQQLLAKYAGDGQAGWVQQGSSSGRIGDSGNAAHWGMAAVAIASHADQAADASAASTASTASTASAARAEGRASSLAARPAGAGPRRGPVAISALGATTADIAAAGGSRGYAYNARGDRTGETAAGATLALGYDQANRLVSVGNEVTYAYDGDGLRTSKTVDGVTTAFAWSEAEELPQLLQSGGTSYVYGPEGMPIEQISAGTPVFLHQDQQGSTRLLTDAGGTVVGRYDYSPWGAVTDHAGTATDLQFDGQYTDPETGYQYLRARYYDPTTGQFLTRDPADAMTRSAYSFALNDPLNLADASGLGVCFLGHNPNGSCRGGSGAIAVTKTFHVVTSGLAAAAGVCAVVAGASVVGNFGVSEACGVGALAFGGLSLASGEVLYATGHQGTGGLITDVIGAVPYGSIAKNFGRTAGKAGDLFGAAVGFYGTGSSIAEWNEGKSSGGASKTSAEALQWCAGQAGIQGGQQNWSGYLQPATGASSLQ